MKRDDKFYMLSINPSQDEAAHLIRKVTGKQVTEFEQLTVEEQEKVIHELKNYSRNCMDLYAENFRREKIKSGKDLVYLGRVETERHYRNSDEEVKEGQAKSGDRKPGLQLHVHIIVSRNDVTQTVRLSPLARSKGSFNELNGKKVMVGFEHMEWKARCATGSSVCMITRLHTQVLRGWQGTHLPLCSGKERGDEHGQIRHPAERIQKREEDAGCVLPDVPFHGESETGSHSGSQKTGKGCAYRKNLNQFMNMDHMFIMRLAALLFGGGIAGCLFPGKSRMSHILFLLLILAETAVAHATIPDGWWFLLPGVVSVLLRLSFKGGTESGRSEKPCSPFTPRAGQLSDIITGSPISLSMAEPVPARPNP